jgi:hypothetical protein
MPTINARVYAAALKYSMGNWDHFRRLLEENPQNRWGGPRADHNLRAVAADAYEEATDDTEGAKHLRDPHQHVVVEGGKVKRGRFNVGLPMTGDGQPLIELSRYLMRTLDRHGLGRLHVGSLVASIPEPASTYDVPEDEHHRNFASEQAGRSHRADYGYCQEMEGADRDGNPTTPRGDLVHASEVPRDIADTTEHRLRDNLLHTVFSPAEWRTVEGYLDRIRNTPTEEAVTGGE